MAKRKRRKRTKKKLLVTKNKKLLKKLKALYLTDALTGIHNYQYLIERIGLELKHAKRYMFSMSLLLVDIYYFRSVNDTYGHHTGDKVLKELAAFLIKFARSTDVITRYGGATFAILLLNTDKEGSVALARRLCKKIQRYTFDSKRNNVKLKACMGLVCFPEDGVDAVASFVESADRALKNAKEAGANNVATSETAFQQESDLLSRKSKDSIKKLKLRLKKAGEVIDKALLESIYGFANAIEARDHYTGEHAEEMVSIVREICEEMALSKQEIVNLEHAAVLHDLGKIGIDDKILRKKGKLTKREYDQIKKHPSIGAEILRPIHFLKEVIPLILYHHERFDGKGYGFGLKGNEIPLGAKILAIADVYQALISDRPYRKAYSKREALKIIKNDSGKKFDPSVVEAFIRSGETKNKK